MIGTLLPHLYIGAARLALALSCVLAACWPQSTAGFFYHPWMAALVHLVTLGWITSSMLGILYATTPTTIGSYWLVRPGDYVAYGLVVVGLLGLVGHFWIEEFGGLAWSAATVTAGALYVAIRFLPLLWLSVCAFPVRLHIGLATVNLSAAAAMGTLVGFDKVYHFLPGYVLSNVFAHAHLAAVGWAGMIVTGVESGLAPSRQRGGLVQFASATCLEAGVVGLFVSLVLRLRWAGFFGVLIVLGFAMAAISSWSARFVTDGRQAEGNMVYHLYLRSSRAFLGIASALGLLLLFTSGTSWWPSVAAAYGVFGLLGFLGQAILGLEARLSSLGGSTKLTFWLWTIAVPVVAAGLSLQDARLVRAGALLLLGAVVSASISSERLFGAVKSGAT